MQHVCGYVQKDHRDSRYMQLSLWTVEVVVKVPSRIAVIVQPLTIPKTGFAHICSSVRVQEQKLARNLQKHCVLPSCNAPMVSNGFKRYNKTSLIAAVFKLSIQKGFLFENRNDVITIYKYTRTIYVYLCNIARRLWHDTLDGLLNFSKKKLPKFCKCVSFQPKKNPS